MTQENEKQEDGKQRSLKGRAAAWADGFAAAPLRAVHWFFRVLGRNTPLRILALTAYAMLALIVLFSGLNYTGTTYGLFSAESVGVLTAWTGMYSLCMLAIKGIWHDDLQVDLQDEDTETTQAQPRADAGGA